MRRILTGAIAATTAAALGAVALPTGSQAFSPVTHGVDLPATISAAQPVRVVTTSLDATGRPVIAVREATTRARAADLLALAPTRSTVGVELDVPVHALDVPEGGDPFRDDQWDLDAIGVPAAWEQSTGDGVTVAVIDTGVDGAHPDLAGQVLTGWDALTGAEGGDTDEEGHGTHVAGTIAALTGNDEGIAGIAPDVRILPVRVLGADGSGDSSDTAEGIVWAVDNGAQVINLSLGGEEQSRAITEAVAYAHEQGVVVVASAGNERESGSPVNYPAADEDVIAVAATDSDDHYGEFSNSGDYVDVAAPGVGILSTTPGDGYARMSGTSMAAPHVAAVAALLLGQDPDRTPEQVQDTLESTAADLGEDGWDPDYGHGRIDAAAALGAGPDDGPGDEPVAPEILVDQPAGPVAYGTRTITGFQVLVNGEAMSEQAVRSCVAAGSGAWRCADTETDGDGVVEVPRVATGAFKVRLDVPETDGTLEASAEAGYAVRAVVRVSRTGKGAITVKVSGAAGQKLTVQRLTGKSWKAVRTYSATANRKVTGLAAGGTYRVVLASTKTLSGVTSGTVKA